MHVCIAMGNPVGKVLYMMSIHVRVHICIYVTNTCIHTCTHIHEYVHTYIQAQEDTSVFEGTLDMTYVPFISDTAAACVLMHAKNLGMIL